VMGGRKMVGWTDEENVRKWRMRLKTRQVQLAPGLQQQKQAERIDDDKSSLEQGRLPLRDRSGRLGSGGGWALAIMVVGGRQKGIIYDVALEEVDEKH
jgi:hypothetical protein